MTTFLFWLAIPLGFSGLPVSAFGIVLLPFAVVSLFNDFAAPRDVVWAMFGIAIVTVVPTIQRLIGRVWLFLDPTEESAKKASLLGSQVFTSATTVVYLANQNLIGAPDGSWLLTSYWFICLTQLWSAFFLLLFVWIARLSSR
jgi:hypothetical protein